MNTNETTRIDGPGIAGEARPFGYVGPFCSPVWTVTPDAHGKDCPCAPCFLRNLETWQRWHKAVTDANHSEKPNSSTTLDPPESSNYDLRAFCNTIYQRVITNRQDSAIDFLRGLLSEARQCGREEVCKRLPRLWGKWNADHWGKFFSTDQDSIAGHYSSFSQPIREFDPRTGGPVREGKS